MHQVRLRQLKATDGGPPQPALRRTVYQHLLSHSSLSYQVRVQQCWLLRSWIGGGMLITEDTEG